MRRTFFVVIVVAMSAVLRADKITKNNGTEIEGRIVEQTDTTVTVETIRDGKLIRVPIFRETIAKIEKSAFKPTTAPTTQTSEEAQRKREEYAARIAAEEKDRSAKFAETQEKKAAAIKAAQAARDEYMEKIKPDLTEIDAKLEDVRTKGKAAEDALADAQKQLKREIDDADRDLRQANSDAYRIPDPNARMRRQQSARSSHDDRVARAKDRLQPQIDDQQKKVNDLAKQQKDLVTKRNALMAAAPVVPK